MTPQQIMTLDKFYKLSQIITPKTVERELKSKYVYIPRFESTARNVSTYSYTRYGMCAVVTADTPELDSWLAETFHPRIVLTQVKGYRGTPAYVGHVDIFRVPESIYPTGFIDPKCTMSLVYDCCRALVYEMLYRNVYPNLNDISRLIHGRNHHHAYTERQLAEEVSIIIDRRIITCHKSLPNLCNRAAEYIQVRLNREIK